MRNHGLVALQALLLVTLAGCGGSVSTTADEGAGGAGGGPSSSVSGGGGAGGDPASTAATTATSSTTGSGGGLPDGFCAEACQATSADGCFPTDACVAYCDTSASAWGPEIGAAFAACASENPLCFETVEGCILGELHPTGSLHTVRLVGSGFDAYDGQTVIVWNDPGVANPFGGEAVIADGAFAFEWLEPVPVSETGAALLLLYIDLDGDQSCKPAADITGSLFTEWNGDYLAPVFTAFATSPLSDADFVCDFTP